MLFITACSQTTIQTTSNILTTTSVSNVPTITASAAYDLIQENISNPKFIILDVRTAAEFNSGHIAGATNIDYESTQFTTDVNLLDKNNRYLVYCATGVRGAAATQIMVGLGFKNVQNLDGGITEWIQDEYPVTAPTATESTTTSPAVPTTSTTTQPTTTIPSTTTMQSMNGLQLEVSVNATNLTLGESLQIGISEYNTLSTINDVTAATNWGVNGLALGACPNINEQPFGVAVFQGNYTSQNISQALPLDIYAATSCPQFIKLITEYDFLPDSIYAGIIQGGGSTPPTPMAAMQAIVDVTGNYTQQNQLNPLVPGLYTVVAGDEWGALVFLHFTVSAITAPSTTQTSSSSFSRGFVTADAPTGLYLSSIANDPEGNLWFTEANANQICRFSPESGKITQYNIPTSEAGPNGITMGPDGNLWFTETEANNIGKISPITGDITEYSVPTCGSWPDGITTGPDGNLWFTEAIGKIGEISPVKGKITEYNIPGKGGFPTSIVAGPDGNLWFTETMGNNIDKISPTTGNITEYSIPNPNADPCGITTGPDGNIWFTETGAHSIGKISLATSSITEYKVSGSFGIAAGPDGNLWFTESSVNKIGEISPNTGVAVEYNLSTIAYGLYGITAGHDGNLWFTENFGSKLGKIAPTTGDITEYAIDN